jgi:hypothetical protein
VKQFEVKVALNEIIKCNLESFMDLLSTLAIGDDTLADISYKVIGFEDDNVIVFSVIGDTTEYDNECWKQP